MYNGKVFRLDIHIETSRAWQASTKSTNPHVVHQLVYTFCSIAVVGKWAILIVFCCVETQSIENVQPIENVQRQSISIGYTY